ncbi:hypothetical protein KC19_VG048400, partial [Ceratodon purpureus]
MSQGEDVLSLVAERDELLQKVAENAEKAASDADVMAQLRDSLAKVAAEKQQVESELNLAQDAFNSRYTSGKAPSKRYSATFTHQLNPLEDVSNVGIVDSGQVRSNMTGSKRNSAAHAAASTRASLSGPSRKTSSATPSRKNSTVGPSDAFYRAIIDEGLPKTLIGATPAVGRSRRASLVGTDARRPSLLVQSNAEDLTQRASILSENSAEVLFQKASILAENNAEALVERASMLSENTADALAQRASVLAESTAVALADTASVLAENTTDVLAQRASILAEAADLIPKRASILTQSVLEALPQRPSLLAERVFTRKFSGAPMENVIDAPMRRLSGAGASRKNSTALISRRSSTAGLPFSVQESEDLARRSLSLRPTLGVAGTSRRNSSKFTGSRIGSGVLPDQLQEKLEILESEIMEAKRNSLLGGSFNEGVVIEDPEYDQPDVYSMPLVSRRASVPIPECGRKYSYMSSGIAAEAGGGSRSSTRSGSSRGSRLAEEAANKERIANLKARVSMLECERERERVAALQASKVHDKNEEMMQRIQQLESALQQAHEDYKILSNETKQLQSRKMTVDGGDQDDRCSHRGSDNRKKCPQDLLRDLEFEIEKKRSDLEIAEFSMQ